MRPNTRQLVIRVFPTALGWMAGGWRGSRLAGLTFNHPDPQAALTALARTWNEDESLILTSQVVDDEATDGQGDLIARLQVFARGDAEDTFRDIRLDLGRLSDFQRRVTDACRRIPAGQAVTYGELAGVAGSPGAARAVGQVMRGNRWPLVVPCHRVIGSGGSLGGFSAPNGLEIKRRLLEREGVVIKAARKAAKREI